MHIIYSPLPSLHILNFITLTERWITLIKIHLQPFSRTKNSFTSIVILTSTVTIFSFLLLGRFFCFRSSDIFFCDGFAETRWWEPSDFVAGGGFFAFGLACFARAPEDAGYELDTT